MLPKNSEIKPPVSVMESLTGGFETMASHLPAVLLPLALDLFLWLGPRLSITPLIQRFINLMKDVPAPDAVTAQNQKAALDMWSVLGERINLFTLFSTWPMGVPSLMSAELPQGMPWGAPVTWPLSSILLLLLYLLTFTLIGLLLGAVYYTLIAWPLREPALPLSQLALRAVSNWAKILLFVLLVLLVGGLLSLPFLVMVGVLQLFSAELATLVTIVWSGAAIWLWFYFAFTLPGMVLRDRSVWGAMWDSVRLVQFNMPSVLGLYLIVVILNWGLGYLWGLPPTDSWLTLAAIGGHAFVSTALIAATFVFYKDRYRFWMELRNQKSGVRSQ